MDQVISVLISQLNRVISWIRQYQLLPLLVNVVFMGLLLFSPNDKVVFVVSFVHLLVMLLVSRSALQAVLFLVIPWTLFASGRSFSAVLLPLDFIESYNYSSPVQIYFSFTPFAVLFLPLITLTVFTVAKQGIRPNHRLYVLFLGLYVAVRLYSALQTQFYVFFSITSLLFEATYITWFLGLLTQVKFSSVLKIIAGSFALVFAINLLVGSAQFLKGSYLGLAAERAHYTVQYGQGADELSGMFRTTGLYTHPNGLALEMTSALYSVAFIILGYVSTRMLRHQQTVFKLLFLVVLGIMASLTLSRVVILVVALFALLEYKIFIDSWTKIRNFIVEMSTKHTAIILVMSVVFLSIFSLLIYRIGLRSYESIFSFQENGGLYTRAVQYKDALNLIKISPWIGHGPGMFVLAQHYYFPQSEIQYFPEDVHNGVLLLISESGVAPVVFLLVILVLAVKYYLAAQSKWTHSFLYSWLFFVFLMISLHRVDWEVLLPTLFFVILASNDQKKLT